LKIQVKVLQKGKVTIPEEIREILGIEEGDYLTMDATGSKLILIPPKVIPNPTDVLAGLAKGIDIKEPIDGELKKASATRVERKVRSRSK